MPWAPPAAVDLVVQRQQAEAAIGTVIVDAMACYEVLTDAPAAADAQFSRQLATMRGDGVETGSPQLDQDS